MKKLCNGLVWSHLLRLLAGDDVIVNHYHFYLTKQNDYISPNPFVLFLNDSHLDWSVSAYCKRWSIPHCKQIFDNAFLHLCKFNGLCSNVRFVINCFRSFHSLDHSSHYTFPPLSSPPFFDPLEINERYNFFSRSSLNEIDFVMVVSHYHEDLRWLGSVPVPFIVLSKTISSQTIYLSKNAGNEVSSYLAYIIRYYDTLPLYSMFLHGHDSDWHQFYSIHFTLQNINLHHGFQNINNIAFSPSWRASKMDGLRAVWPELFLRELGEMPSEFHSRCCAQFVVRRDRIRLRSLQFYERLLEYVWEEDALSSDGYHFDMSFYMEYLWHYIFGESAVMEDVKEHFASVRVDADHEYGLISYYL